MPPTEIQLVAVPVSDQDRALRFYRDVLGLEVMADHMVAPMMRWLQLRLPASGGTIVLATWFPSMPAGSLRGLVLGSSDLDADVARLRAQDVDLGAGVVEESWGRYVAFADPDGNGLVLQTFTV